MTLDGWNKAREEARKVRLSEKDLEAMPQATEKETRECRMILIVRDDGTLARAFVDPPEQEDPEQTHNDLYKGLPKTLKT